MKIAILTGYYPPPFNANAVRAMYIVRALRKHSYDVTVMPLNGTYSNEGFYGERLVNLTEAGGNNDKERFYEKPPLTARIMDIAAKHLGWRKTIQPVLKWRPDIVIATIPPVEAPLLAYSIAREIGAKLIVDVQDLADDYRILERPWLTPIVKTYFKLVYRVLSKASLVIVTTEYMKEVLRSRLNGNPARIEVVPNGVDNTFYLECYKKRKKSTRSTTLVFLGDLNFKYHKLDSFLYAFRIVKARHSDFKLKVIGSGKLLPKLVQLARKLSLEDEVEFLGYVERSKLPEKLGEALFAIAGRPSRNNPWIVNTMRLTILEYLSCGLPVLAYGPPNSYTQYFIEKHHVGIYVPSDDPKYIAMKTLKLVEHVYGNENVVEQCRRTALKYDWDTIAEKFAEHLSLIAS